MSDQDGNDRRRDHRDGQRGPARGDGAGRSSGAPRSGASGRGGYRSDDRRSAPGRDDRGGYRSDDRRSGGGRERSSYRSDDRARGGSGRPQDEERRGGPRLTPKSPRKPEPAIREGVTGHEVDRGVKSQLRTLSKENAEGVAQHLVMVAELLDVEPEAA